MTYEAIEARRDELEELMNAFGYTDEIRAEWAKLHDMEKELDMENAIAIAKTDDVVIFISYMYECGYAINAKVNGEWMYDDCYTAVNVMKKFCELARKHNVKTCNVTTEWLDPKYLESIDAEKARYADEEEYADACMASNYGDDTLLERYNRKHGIEKEYSPSNPWDAPGMSIRDFI